MLLYYIWCYIWYKRCVWMTYSYNVCTYIYIYRERNVSTDLDITVLGLQEKGKRSSLFCSNDLSCLLRSWRLYVWIGLKQPSSRCRYCMVLYYIPAMYGQSTKIKQLGVLYYLWLEGETVNPSSQTSTMEWDQYWDQFFFFNFGCSCVYCMCSPSFEDNNLRLLFATG